LLSERAGAIKRSPTLALTARVAQLRREGADIISFGAGEPDFPTPEYIAEAGITAIREGYTRYADSAGFPELREAISATYQRENHLRYSPDEVIVSCGAKHAVYNALMVLCNPGDEVIVPAPHWPTYLEQIRLAGATPVILDCSVENGYLPDPDALKRAVTARTKVFILTSPNNPTGTVWPRPMLKQIASLALGRDFWILCDEIYERLVYEGEHQSMAALSKDVWERTVTVSGVSKTFAMTGWRIGWAAAPKPVVQAMSALQDQVTSNPCSISMRAAITALHGPKQELERMKAIFQERRDVMFEAVTSNLPGFRCEKPAGAFYLFPDVSDYLNPSMPTAAALAEYLLEEAKCAMVPGDVFGAPNCVRLSYTLSTDMLVQGVQEIRKALDKLL